MGSLDKGRFDMRGSGRVIKTKEQLDRLKMLHLSWRRH